MARSFSIERWYRIIMITTRTVLVSAAIVISSTFGGWIAQQSRPVSAAVQIPAGYVALNPGRIYDSRGPSGTAPRLAANQQVTIKSGQPGASAVGVNITLTDTTAAGFVAAWPSGAWPGTSVINSTTAGENIANFLLIPVAADGTFQIMTQNATHLIVDIMGYMAGGSAVAPTGFTGHITGYGPGFSITEISGDVTNGAAATVNVRADVLLPNGAVETDSVFSIPAGATRGWSVLVTGIFTSGATVTFIQI
jgi:hypothetical protein